MLINSLSLDNFTSHRKTYLQFKKTPKIHLFLGSLNAGKSSIKKAIEFALVGQCESYRKRNDNVRDLIHDLDDAKRFQVRVETDWGIAERGVALTNRYVEWINEKGESCETVELPFRPEIISACLNTTDFFLWDSKVQKEAILNIIGVEVKHEAILEKFDGDLAALEFVSGLKFNSIPVLDAAYEKVYRERTDVNREIKQTKAPDPPEGEEPPIDKIEAQLRGIEDQEKEAIAETAELIGHGKGFQRNAMDRLRGEITTLNNWFENIQKPTKDAAKELTAKLNKAKKNEAAHKKKHDELERARTYALAHMTQHSQAKVLLEHFDGSCIGATFKCPAQVKQIQAGVVEQTALEREKQGEAHDLKEKMMKLEADYTSPSEVEAEAEVFRKTTKSYNSNKEKLKELEEKLKDLEGQEDTTENPEVVKLEKWKAELAERIKVGRSVLEKAKQWKLRRDMVDQVAEKMKELEIQSGHLESLVEFFGPKGVRLQLIHDKVSLFQDAVNGPLKQFGFELDIQVDPWLIKARNRPVASLSRSERFRLGVALQIALAKWSKFNFICVDNAEILTPPFRMVMLDMIKEAKLDQSFVFWSLMIPEKEFKKPPVKWAQFYMVKNEEGVSSVVQL
jgi:hypothetical protein